MIAALCALPLLNAEERPPSVPDVALYVETLDVVWETVRDAYYDPEMGGVDWDAVYAAKRPAVEAADDISTLRMILRSMLAKLGQSHFGIIGSRSPVLESPRFTGDGEIGVTVTAIDDRVLVGRVRKGYPAERAGIRPGYALTEIDGDSLERIASDVETMPMAESLRAFYFVRYVQSRLEGDSGTTVTLGLVNGSGEASTVELEHAPIDRPMSGQVANMPRMPLEWEIRKRDDGIVVIRFNLFAFQVNTVVQDAIRNAAAEEAAGIIMDLRGNPGGVGMLATSMASLLVTEKTNLGVMQLRSGHLNFKAFPQPDGYRGAVVILVDGQSASTSEVLAAGLQESGRAVVVGEPTAGAVLPSLFKELPNGDLLQYVFADFRTVSGNFLEGRGVTPDIHAAPDREALLSGRDLALEAAVERIWQNQAQSP